MKLFDIIKTVGASVIKTAVPYGGIIVDVVNDLLPDDKKLSKEATGSQLEAAIQSLPPEQQASILEKEFDVELTQIKESNSTLRTMLEMDALSTHTTRPWAIKQVVKILAFVTISIVTVWCIGVLTGDTEMVNTVVEGWPWLAVVINPLVMCLWAYFGILKQEHKNKLSAATGSPIGKMASLVSSIFKNK